MTSKIITFIKDISTVSTFSQSVALADQCDHMIVNSVSITTGAQALFQVGCSATQEPICIMAVTTTANSNLRGQFPVNQRLASVKFNIMDLNGAPLLLGANSIIAIQIEFFIREKKSK